MNTKLYLHSPDNDFSILQESSLPYEIDKKSHETLLYQNQKSFLYYYLEMNCDISSFSAIASYHKIQSDSISSITESRIIDVDLLQKVYLIENVSNIKNLLDEKENFISILITCRIEIIKRFGTVIPRIEIVTDSEDETWKTIFITIPNQNDFLKALDKLEELLNNWFAKQPKEFRKLITIQIT